MSDITATMIGNIIGTAILIGTATWVYMDAKAIGSDNGRLPGLVNTRPGRWAVGVVLLLAAVLPAYLLCRLRYKRLQRERRAERVEFTLENLAGVSNAENVWPPPPTIPPSA